MSEQQELLNALIELQKQIHAHYKMNVRKDFSLLVADAQASKAIANAQARLVSNDDDTEGQDRESYSDTQDRESYSVS